MLKNMEITFFVVEEHTVLLYNIFSCQWKRPPDNHMGVRGDVLLFSCKLLTKLANNVNILCRVIKLLIVLITFSKSMIML